MNRLGPGMQITNNPLYRPPAEADSLVLQIDEGCPYNRCSFCGMYRAVPYVRRGMEAVWALIRDVCGQHPDARRVFLGDGDVMRRPFDDLQRILAWLGEHLAALARVNAYTTGSGILGKTDAQLKILRERRLHTLYMGLESGDETTLEQVNKRETAEEMIEAALKAQAAGLHMSVMVLLGLGGQNRGPQHAQYTAEALNRMQPRLLSFLRVVPIPGTAFHDDVENGRLSMLSEHDIVQELTSIIARLDLSRTVMRANHSSNVVPIEARLPKDKPILLAALDELLSSGVLDRRSPTPEPAHA